MAKILRRSIALCFYAFIFIPLINGFDLEGYMKIIPEIASNPDYVVEFETLIKDLLELEPDFFDYSPFKKQISPFNCTPIPPSPSTITVNQLRPSDIKIVAALGDSLTAGLGIKARTILGLLFEYRGYSWSIGGKSDLNVVATMPNILKKYNPNVFGFSSASDFVWLPKNKNNLNVAVSGQEANHIPDQARELIKRLKRLKNLDYKNDWKLITIFIGGNDLCDFCKDRNLHSPTSFINFLKEGLDILFAELPRTFINIVTVFRPSEIQKLNKRVICTLLHKFECPCAAFSDPERDKELQEYYMQYLNYTYSLIQSNSYERDDFTVVIQPFMQDMTIPVTTKNKVDLSYFAPDCFHFSLKGQAQTAIGLWNSMLTPVGKKSTTWNIEKGILCPDPGKPYFYTKQNSL